ncbi:MAG: ribose-5-phosphate isomerase A, partial [Clostridia bacterium]|nr:ribose-5-phosphate isomerase A [Clostridia bacterium]
DNSKLVSKLGTKFAIPVECYPYSINYIKEELKKLGANEVEIRKAKSKDGPVITETGSFILDVKFNQITEHLEKDIKSISGVIESGLFIGYNVEIITC